jgi:hypothetical protein
LSDAIFEPAVGFPHLIAKFADLTLGRAPLLAVFLAVFAELLRKPCSDMLNPVRPFLSGHDWSLNSPGFAKASQNFFSSSTNAASPFLL